MINTIRNAFILLRDNIILIQPLIFYLLILGFVSSPIALDGTLTYASIFAIILVFFFTAAFLAGWFYIIKLAIETKDKVYENLEEKNIASFSLLKQFFTGVGEYFLPLVATLFLYIVAFLAFSFLAYKFGLQYIGKVDLSPDMVKAINTGSYKELIGIMNAPESYQSIKAMSLWGLYISGLSILFSFLTLYIGPALLYDSKNPFKAIFLNFKFLFLNLPGSLAVIIFLTCLNLFITMFNVLSALNIVFEIITLLLIFMYMSYHVMLVFLYYEQETQSNRNRGTECIGEIESSN